MENFQQDKQNFEEMQIIKTEDKIDDVNQRENHFGFDYFDNEKNKKKEPSKKNIESSSSKKMIKPNHNNSMLKNFEISNKIDNDFNSKIEEESISFGNNKNNDIFGSNQFYNFNIHKNSKKYSNYTNDFNQNKSNYKMTIKTNGSKKSSKINQKKRILEFDNHKNKNLSTNIFGDFELEDIPMNILKARRFEEVIEFIVEWKIRDNGFKPKNSVITNLEFKKFNPEFLMNFYEQRLIFGDTIRQKRNQYQKNKNFSNEKNNLEKNSNSKIKSQIKIESHSEFQNASLKNESIHSLLKDPIDINKNRNESTFKI